MTHATRVTLGILFFVIVGTANAGGYRFGVSDQAFYIPAISMRADPSLFPRDRGVFEPQMRLWAGDEIFGAVTRVTGVPTPALFASIYLLTMIGLAVGCVYLARSLGLDWWAIAVALVLLTLRHRIARTGANSLEGYMHPRMLSFACGIAALAFVARGRPAIAGVWTMVAAVVHTSTAIWFGGVVMVAALWPHRHLNAVRYTVVAAVVASSVVLGILWPSLPVMDATWLRVLGDRDYLFSADWPVYAWATNLLYPVVIAAIYRRRVRLGVTSAGEGALVAGLIALVAVFLVSIPLAELHVAFFVQLQANRVFWLLDAAVVVYLSWWLMADVARRWPDSRRKALVGALALLVASRGAFVLHESGRALVQYALPADDWTHTMTWLRTQPASWNVLADPGHAWKYGSSIRVAALRDTPLELGKDPAMAMYDRQLAMRVAQMTPLLGGFDDWLSVDEVAMVAAATGADVFVDRGDRSFPLPVLFRNRTFVVYDLR